MNKKEMKVMRDVIQLISLILMIITLILQIFAYNAFVYSIMCNFILLLTTIILVINGILKNYKEIAFYGFIYTVWFVSLIITFLNF